MISQTDRQTEQTGFPSVNKPWLKYYSEEAIQEKHDADEEAYNAAVKHAIKHSRKPINIM